MHRRAAAHTALTLMLGVCLGGAARAATIEVPPITITEFSHRVTASPAGVQDYIDIPGDGYSSAGFTSSFGTGDVVRVRIQPPPGKAFRVRWAPGHTGMNFSTYWQCSGGETSHFNPAVLTFENLHGAVPGTLYTLTIANAILVEAQYNFVVTSDCEFTAIIVDITVDQGLAATPRIYSDVQSYSSPSFGAGCASNDPAFHAMEIVDTLPTPAVSSSWGRLKALYR